MHNVLTFNKIWKQRLVNIGVVTPELCESYNLTGVMARSCGIKRDLRLSPKDVYSHYNSITFKSYFGVNGDCYDRYLIRMLEMGESLHISNIVINKLMSTSNSINFTTSLIAQELFFSKKSHNSYNSMEDLINHFLHWHTGLSIKKDVKVAYIEAPKGEFGVTLVSNNTTKPHKCKVKSPSYYNLQALPQLSKGHYLADIAALIGTIDIVFGEVDR